MAESGVTDSPGEVTLLLNELRRGDKDALGRLIPLVYGELRRLAGHYLQAERVGHTLQPTALVHEAYLRLVEQDRADWRNRAQFLGVAAQLMRRILVDYARARETAKRAGPADGVDAVNLEGGMDGTQVEEILAVDEALERLTVLHFDAERPPTIRALSTWLSPDDAGRLFEACLSAPRPGFRVVFGVSANTRGGWVSLDEARALGYQPRDDAEAYAAEVIAAHGEPDPADPVLAHLGGEFTLPRFDAEIPA